MSEKLGIENLKEACINLINTGEKIDKAFEDGKITGMETISISLSSAPGFIKLVKNGKLIKAEFDDMDDEESAELKAAIANELDLRNDYVETKIEKGFNVAIALGEFLDTKKEDFESPDSEDTDKTEE